jgi:hypothetical protein
VFGSRTPLSRLPIRTSGARVAPDAARAATFWPGTGGHWASIVMPTRERSADVLVPDRFEVIVQAAAQIVGARHRCEAPSPLDR